MSTRTHSLKPAGLFGDFRLLLILFVGFRLLLLVAYEPILPDDGVERGVGVGGDRLYHWQLTELTANGDWPFIDWWSEFPPVWYTLTTGLYQFQGAGANYGSWSMALGFLLILFETGTLVLVQRIGTRLHGELTGMALAWIYALTIAPVVFLFWNFEVMVVFFLLLGLWYMLKKDDVRSGVAIAIGALVKFTPALLFGAVFRFRPPRVAATVIGIALAIFAGVYVLLYMNNAAQDADPDMVTTSLTAQFGKASYQTVWALIDGNYRTGNFGTVEDHFNPEFTNEVQGNDPVIPSIVRLALAGAVGLFVFVRTRRFDDRGLVAFVTITLLIFFLQAQGWSPQWMVQIIPLLLLCFPDRNGALLVVTLSFLVFAEYPLLFNRTGDTAGEITGPLQGPFAALILLRTLFLVAACVGLYVILRQEPVPEE